MVVHDYRNEQLAHDHSWLSLTIIKRLAPFDHCWYRISFLNLIPFALVDLSRKILGIKSLGWNISAFNQPSSPNTKTHTLENAKPYRETYALKMLHRPLECMLGCLTTAALVFYYHYSGWKSIVAHKDESCEYNVWSTSSSKLALVHWCWGLLGLLVDSWLLVMI